MGGNAKGNAEYADNTKNKKSKNNQGHGLPNKRTIGAEKEAMVSEYLQQNGYKIIGRNFFCRQGEIDLIAKKEEYLVFIEVKYRKNTAYGMPEEAVTPAKQKHLRAAARYYLYKNRLSFEQPIRFDVVGVLGEEIRITTGAF